MAVDSTDIELRTKAKMSDKCGTQNKKRRRKNGYLKIYITVNVKSKKILSMKIIADKCVHGKALPELLENIIKSDSRQMVK